MYYLESKNKLDLTGKQQHGFKRNKSTATAGALLLFNTEDCGAITLVIFHTSEGYLSMCYF